MNRLRNYRRLSQAKRDSEEAKEELYATLARYDEGLKEKMLEYIMHTNRNAMMEIERRKLSERAGLPPPRIDFYLKSILYFSLTKLHKGDKLKAYEILEEIRDSVLLMDKEHVFNSYTES